MFWETFIHFYEKYVDEFLANFRFPAARLIIPLLLSLILLVLAFPPADLWILAWAALVPFFMALDGKTARAAFGTGYLLGVLFFSFTIFWIIHVTILGTTLLILYLALYSGFFALGYHYFSKRNLLEKMFLLPALWVILEYTRGHFLSGFGWASLCHSQYKNLLTIQIADITGMLGVSFLIVMVNVFLKETYAHHSTHGKWLNKESIRALAVIVVIAIAVKGYGAYQLWKPSSGSTVSVAVIQGNIPLEERNDPREAIRIMKTYLDLTKETALLKPDLMIWPESSFPGFIWEEPQLFAKLKEAVAEHKVPLLFGAITQRDGRYYNSALLLDKNGELAQQYDKLHLVPFGEYIPLRGRLPFLADIVPIDDFTAGKEATVFSLKNALSGSGPAKFSVLICFEDAIERISRKMSSRGADFLINITNDAWFQDSKEPFMHMQSSVFRAVENRRSVVRSANTGVSCFIDPQGKVTKYVRDAKGKKTFITGFTMEQVSLNNTGTFYARYGDIFVLGCGIVFGLGIVRLFLSPSGFKD